MNNEWLLKSKMSVISHRKYPRKEKFKLEIWQLINNHYQKLMLLTYDS